MTMRKVEDSQKEPLLHVLTDEQFNHLMGWIGLQRNDLTFQDNMRFHSMIQAIGVLPIEILSVWQKHQRLKDVIVDEAKKEPVTKKEGNAKK